MKIVARLRIFAFLLFVSFVSIFADTSNLEYCQKSFYDVSRYYKISAKILNSLATIESKTQPYAILLQTRNKNKVIKFLQIYHIKYKTNRGSHIISVYPNNQKQAIIAYDGLIKHKKFFKVFNYDLGIMQVNESNFKLYRVDEKKFYMDCLRNIFLGTDILRKCYNRFKNTKNSAKNTIECYHRGASYEKIAKSNYSYFNRFYGVYNSSKRQK